MQIPGGLRRMQEIEAFDKRQEGTEERRKQERKVYFELMNTLGAW